MVLPLADVLRNPIPQRATLFVNHHEIAARLERSPNPAQHLPRLGEVVVDVVQVCHIDGSGGQARIIAAPKHRANLGEFFLLRLFLQGLNLALPDLLREDRSRLAHQAGKDPGVLAAARTDVGNGRAFAQAEVGEDGARDSARSLDLSDLAAGRGSDFPWALSAAWANVPSASETTVATNSRPANRRRIGSIRFPIS